MTTAATTTDSPTIMKANPKPIDGDAQLRQIARAGRQWKTTIGRKADMESESPLDPARLLLFYLSTATHSVRIPTLHRVGTTVGR